MLTTNQLNSIHTTIKNLHLEHIFVSSTENNNIIYNSKTNTFYIPETETDLSRLFQNCDELKTVKFINFNFENVTSIMNMFWGCYSIESIDLSTLNTSNLKIIQNCFYFCHNLKTVKLPEFKNPIKSLSGCFDNCFSLKEINLKTLILSNDFDKIFRTVFKNCKNLEKLYINNLEFNIKDIYSIGFWSCFTGVNSEIEIYCKPKMKEIIQEIWDKTHVKI